MEHELRLSKSVELDNELIKKKTILVTLFFGLPGLGKTTLWREMQKIEFETDIMLTYIGEDDMWKSLMKEQKQKTPQLTDSECFWKIFAKGNYLFWLDMQKKMQQFAQSDKKSIILYLDKIVYPDTLDDLLNKVLESKPDNCEIKFIAFVPEGSKNFSYKQNKYPFSLSLVFDCINRVINRKEHATLKGNPKRSTSVIIELFQKFRNFEISNSFLQQKGILGKIALPFNKEIEKFEEIMGPKMINNLGQILNTFEPGQILEQDKVEILLDDAARVCRNFSFPSKDEIYSKAKLELLSFFQRTEIFDDKRNSF